MFVWERHCNAYLLFYERVNPKKKDLKEEQAEPKNDSKGAE